MRLTISASIEKKLLQCIVAMACIVPLFGGAAGALGGIQFAGANVSIDSHFRYLSGLLLGIGIGFLLTIPRIERKGAGFRLLTGIVATGGAARLLGIMLNGDPGPVMTAALMMELIVTPLLCLWQYRVARRFDK